MLKLAAKVLLPAAAARYLAASGLDITPTVALHCAQRLLGRGIDRRATLAAFGTPGRFAKARSTSFPACEFDLVDQSL